MSRRNVYGFTGYPRADFQRKRKVSRTFRMTDQAARVMSNMISLGCGYDDAMLIAHNVRTTLPHDPEAAKRIYREAIEEQRIKYVAGGGTLGADGLPAVPVSEAA